MRAPYVDATMRAWLIGVVGTLPQEISPQRVDASREDVLVKCERDGNLEDSPDPENAEDASFARENKALLDGPKPVPAPLVSGLHHAFGPSKFAEGPRS
ncbi:MAG: hypothetical protein OXJ64_17490 [Boseongicola sp.]|nr:hypothetical protein [Boseongicola sp.]